MGRLPHPGAGSGRRCGSSRDSSPYSGLFGIAGGYLLGTMFQRAALRTGLLDATE
jgi:hypothetical protein